MHTSEKCRRGKQQISHREWEKARERERHALGLTIFKHVFILFCVNTEAIASEGEKEDKRQHKYDASQK